MRSSNPKPGVYSVNSTATDQEANRSIQGKKSLLSHVNPHSNHHVINHVERLHRGWEETIASGPVS